MSQCVIEHNKASVLSWASLLPPRRASWMRTARENQPGSEWIVGSLSNVQRSNRTRNKRTYIYILYIYFYYLLLRQIAWRKQHFTSRTALPPYPPLDALGGNTFEPMWLVLEGVQTRTMKCPHLFQKPGGSSVSFFSLCALGQLVDRCKMPSSPS